jgi:GntP family gluconate:H+ symporter
MAWLASEVSAQPAGDAAGQVAEAASIDVTPVLLVVVGIVAVLGMIIGLKLNAFLALIISALIVSLGVGYFISDPQESSGARMGAVVSAFGNSAAGIGIVIAMAAIIGKCMLDSGAADRIVRSAVKLTGEKLAALGLMISGFVLAVPVFFDTVFYLLVPLARSLYQRTGKNYLRYLMAIATGGAITHTLVPPTPGPLLVAAILGVDIGLMMLIGVAVAIPAAVAGLIFSVVVDRRMPVEMRSLGLSETKHKALSEDRLPSLGVALLPVILPVGLILAGTVSLTLADAEDRAKLTVADIRDFGQLASSLDSAAPDTPAGRVMSSQKLSDEERATLQTEATDEASKTEVVGLLNDVLLDVGMYDETAYAGVVISGVAKSKLAADKLRMKPVDVRRMNRTLLEDAMPELIEKHQWDSSQRRVADGLGLWSNPNFALLLAALVAMLMLKRVRSLSWRSLGDDVEESLMSGGVIILITAAGGAFGAMLTSTNISETIKDYFSGSETAGIGLLLLAFGVAAVLKVAQGSSTVAMIIGAGMMSAIIGDAKPEYSMVYVATAVGAGSLMGSWMNDSGFWVFTKMGGLTEGESLRSWTPLLIVLSLVSLGVTVALSQVMPMRVDL